MSRGVALYLVGFCLVWFGGIVGFVIIGQLPHKPTLLNIAATTGALLFALVPAAAYALIPYRVTLSDDGTCVFRSLLRERRMRVQRINEIDWDEDYVIIRHDDGTCRILTEPAFKPFVARLIALNPTIRVADELRQSLDDLAA